MRKVRLGVIGANPNRGWASRAHLPAVKALEDFELTAVCTTRQETAEAAAQKFGALRAYDSAEKLIADPDIEAVTVCVRVDRHFAPVMAALRARKHVFCEWPLGHSTSEAQQMTDLAVQQGVVHRIGFQTRANPALRRARALVEMGFIGALRSVTMLSAVPRWGAEISADTIYGADAKVGVNIVNIQGGHSLDALCYGLGEFTALNATVANLRKETRVIETGQIIPFTAPDQMVVNGTLENGAVVAVHLQSGVLQVSGFRMEIRGTEGELVLTSDDSIPTGTLRLRGARRGEKELSDLSDDTPPVAGLSQVVASIAESYRSFASAIRAGEGASPDFRDALARHRLLDAIHHASATGQRQLIAPLKR